MESPYLWDVGAPRTGGAWNPSAKRSLASETAEAPGMMPCGGSAGLRVVACQSTCMAADGNAAQKAQRKTKVHENSAARLSNTRSCFTPFTKSYTPRNAPRRLLCAAPGVNGVVVTIGATCCSRASQRSVTCGPFLVREYQADRPADGHRSRRRHSGKLPPAGFDMASNIVSHRGSTHGSIRPTNR